MRMRADLTVYGCSKAPTTFFTIWKRETLKMDHNRSQEMLPGTHCRKFSEPGSTLRFGLVQPFLSIGISSRTNISCALIRTVPLAKRCGRSIMDRGEFSEYSRREYGATQMVRG